MLGFDNVLDVGNFNFVVMMFINYDVLIGWYLSENFFMEVVVFYKDIDNFIVDVNGIGMVFNDLLLMFLVN